MKEKLATGASYWTSGIYIGFGAMTFQDWIGLVGLCFVVLTYFTNRYYKARTLEELKRQGLDKDNYEKIGG